MCLPRDANAIAPHHRFQIPRQKEIGVTAALNLRHQPNQKLTFRHAASTGRVWREDVLLPLEMTQVQLAKRLGVWRLTVSELLLEKRALSPEMAARVAKLLHTTQES